jgi:septal ring-binding cell division protein DamX
MYEYITVSSSSYDPASLAAKLTEKSSEGWTVVSIVPAGGDVAAFLSRPVGGATATVGAPAAEVAPAEVAPAEVAPAEVAVETEAASTETPAEAVAEPAGWAAVSEPEVVVVAAAEPEAVAVAAAVAPAVPAGWYADPAGRFELRYWDSNAWTEHVSRAGQQFTDPPVA